MARFGSKLINKRGKPKTMAFTAHLRGILCRLDDMEMNTAAAKILEFICERSVTEEILTDLVVEIKNVSTYLDRTIDRLTNSLMPKCPVTQRVDTGCRWNLDQNTENALCNDLVSPMFQTLLKRDIIHTHQSDALCDILKHIVYYLLAFAITHTCTRHTEFEEDELVNGELVGTGRIRKGKPFYVYHTEEFIRSLQILVPKAANKIKPKPGPTQDELWARN